jgi:hypothetical protein
MSASRGAFTLAISAAEPAIIRDSRSRPRLCPCFREHERRQLWTPAARLEPLAPVRRNDFALRFFPEPYELTVFAYGIALVEGTPGPQRRAEPYARYLGC